jgi:hypothetical protein
LVHTPIFLLRFPCARLAPALRYSGGGPSLVRRSAAKGEIHAGRQTRVFEGFGRVFVTRSKYPLGCLGLLKKHPSKISPARPISTSIYASKSATKSTSIYTTICATTSHSSETDVLCSDRQNPVLRPVPQTRIPECAQAVKGWQHLRPPRSGAETRAAQRASTAGVLVRPSTCRENQSKRGVRAAFTSMPSIFAEKLNCRTNTLVKSRHRLRD